MYICIYIYIDILSMQLCEVIRGFLQATLARKPRTQCLIRLAGQSSELGSTHARQLNKLYIAGTRCISTYTICIYIYIYIYIDLLSVADLILTRRWI